MPTPNPYALLRRKEKASKLVDAADAQGISAATLASFGPEQWLDLSETARCHPPSEETATLVIDTLTDRLEARRLIDVEEAGDENYLFAPWRRTSNA